MLPHPPWLLIDIPDGVGEIVIDVTDNVDDADEESEERIHEPTVGHVARGNGTHSVSLLSFYTRR